MSILARNSWDLVLRIVLCYIVFYTTIYFLMALVNGLSVAAMILPHPPSYNLREDGGVIWLKFTCELGARLAAATLLVALGVPRFRFARLEEGHLFTNFSSIFPRWIGPMFVLALVTSLGQQLPIAQVMPLWLLFQFVFTFAVIHYMMHGVRDEKKLRLLEDA